MEFPDLYSTNYSASVQKLRNKFTIRLPEYRRDEIKVRLFAHPFDLAVEGSPDDCQIELIELQADMDTKRGYSENSLVDLYKLCLQKASKFVPHARKMIFLFRSTFCCGQFISKLKFTKTRCRSQLNDEHLTSQLRVATTSVKADIDKICKDSKFLVFH